MTKPIVTHRTISIWPTHNRRRKVWISAALVETDTTVMVTTFGRMKSEVQFGDIVSTVKTANALLVTLKSGEKWEIGGLESLEVER